MVMTVLLTNNARSTLLSGINALQTEIRLRAGGGNTFPTITAPGQWFPITIEDSVGAIEIMRVIARSGDVFTVKRAQEGTTAKSFSANDVVELRLTVGAMQELVNDTHTNFGRIYMTPADGVDSKIGVPAGYYFNVRSPSDDSYVDEYQNVNGVAVATGKSYPSGALTQAMSEQIDKIGSLDYLSEQLDQIAVDKGWDASFVVDASGKTQQEINNNQKKRNEQYILVTDEGVVPNSTNDQSALINAADEKAKTLGKSLYFPSGTYLGSALSPSVSWHGDGVENTRIKHFNPTSAFTGFLVATGVPEGTIFKGISFDGSVSADPLAWNSTNYNSFTGAIAFVLSYSKKVYFQNCNFENSFWSNVRVEGCENVFFTNCNTKKARGNFGDGIYTTKSKNIYSLNCTAEDFTRIGFVKEQDSHNFVQFNCHAKNGHDGSIMYGGTEYNAGFWNENASNSEIAYCTATDIKHYGFITSTGTVVTSNGNNYWHTLTNCTAKNCDYGFNAQSFANAPVFTQTVKCKAFNCTYPFSVTCNNAADIYEFNNCVSDLDWNRQVGNTIKGFIITGSARGKIKIQNTMFSRKNSVAADLTDKTKYIADILHYGAVQQDVEISNCYVDDGSAVVIKQINFSGRIGLNIDNTKVDLRKIANMNTKFTATRSEIVSADIYSTAKIDVVDCDVSGQFTATIADLIKFSGGNYKALANSDTLFIASSLNTKKQLVKFSNFEIRKNITDGDYAVRLQFEGLNKPITVFTDVLFENTSATTAAGKSFVWCVRSKDASQTVIGSTNVLYQGVIKDSSVANLQKTNTILVNDTTLTGITAAVLH